jgi:hypothetical protein
MVINDYFVTDATQQDVQDKNKKEEDEPYSGLSGFCLH